MISPLKFIVTKLIEMTTNIEKENLCFNISKI